MKHPEIIPGRNGLPPTSNIPWSADEERLLRFLVLSNFLFMWISLIFGGVGAWVFRRVALFPFLFVFSIAGIFFFIRLQRFRRMLYAMLLNKPRDTQGLTQWTEHPWAGGRSLGDASKVSCDCGRSIDLLAAPYFKDTRRFSCVCDCGRGHFMIMPYGWTKL